jgi:hypothetical protein
VVSRRLQPIALAALAAGALVTGCGKKTAPNSDDAGAKTTAANVGGGHQVTVTDPHDDVRALTQPVSGEVNRGLDLTSVGVRRSGKKLTVTFRTAGPPRGEITQSLRVYDRNLVGYSFVEVRHRDGAKPKAVGAARPGQEKPATVRVKGNEVVVSTPLTRLSREKNFKWRASTSVREETVDESPDTDGETNFFP